MQRRAGQALANGDCAKVEGRCVQRRRTVTATAAAAAAEEEQQRWMDAPPPVDGWAGRRPLLVVTWSKSRELSSPLSPTSPPSLSRSPSNSQSMPPTLARKREEAVGATARIAAALLWLPCERRDERRREAASGLDEVRARAAAAAFCVWGSSRSKQNEARRG